MSAIEVANWISARQRIRQAYTGKASRKRAQALMYWLVKRAAARTDRRHSYLPLETCLVDVSL